MDKNKIINQGVTQASSEEKAAMTTIAEKIIQLIRDKHT